MLLQGQIGPSIGSDGAFPNARQGKTGDVIVSELNGRYYEQTSRQNVFNVATQALVTTTVGLATTYTGLALSNPVGNTKNLAILKVTFALGVITAAANTFGVAAGYNGSTNVTHTTPVTPRSSLFGTGAAPTALADVSATLPTAPFYVAFLGCNPSATTNGGTLVLDFEGSLVIPPGGYVLTTTQAVVTTGFWGSFSWMEIAP